MAIVEEYKIETGSEVERSLRKIINEWSEKIPFHPYKNLGDKINITAVTYSPIYLLDCLTQFYSVEDAVKERQFGNGFTYKAGKTYVPHNFKRETFEQHIERYCLPGSETVHACNICSGSGKCNCDKCNGKGAAKCNGCGGTGNCSQCGGSKKKKCTKCNGGQQTCSTCNGTGGVNVYDNFAKAYVFRACISCGGSRTQRCSGCSGNGYTTCWGCMGSGHCNTCSGKGTLTCNNCRGTGKTTCLKCNGEGKMISYTERAEKWDYFNKNAYVLSPAISNDFENTPVKENNTTEFICDEYAERLENNLYPSEPAHFQQVYKTLLNDASVPVSLTVSGNAKILEQYTRVQRIPAHYVRYTFEKGNYGLVVFPKDNDVFEEDGPITHFRKELIQVAHQHLKRKNYGKSAEYAEQAVKMGLDTRDPLLEKIHKKVSTKIKANYKIGAFAGAWITAYFISLAIISWLNSPTYFLNTINKNVQSWGSNFLLTNNIILILLIAIFSISTSVKLAGSKMVPFPGTHMKPEGMRFATGFVTAAFYTIIIGIVFLFLNYTGALLLVSKTIYYLLGFIFPHQSF